jgi:hypothetical protein
MHNEEAMTPRDRVLTALSGRMPDRIPFVIFNNKLPDENITKQLLEAQACIINKSTVYRVSTGSIKSETEQLEDIDGLPRKRICYHTDAGVLTTIKRDVPGTIWIEKNLFTGPQDYEPLEAFITSREYTPCFDDFLKDDMMYEGQSLARPETIYTPVQDLICKYMGVEVFCMEMIDRFDRLMKLCEIIAEDRRKRLEIVAASPAKFAVIEGNVITDVIGPERFEKNHIPYIEEACELLSKNGKLASAHLDDNNKIMVDVIAKTSLDIIESFTPPPDCNLPLRDALEVWPGKIIQINFPSSIHNNGPDEVQKAAKELIKQAAPGIRFLVGVSEDISGGGVDTLVPLARAVYENGKTPIT